MRFDISKHWLILFVPVAFLYICFLVLGPSRDEGFIPHPMKIGEEFSEPQSTSRTSRSTNTAPNSSETSTSLKNNYNQQTSELAITEEAEKIPHSSNPPSVSQSYEELQLQPLTIHTNNGRLGNQMFLLGILIGLCLINERNLTIMPETLNNLSPYFDLNYPVVNRTAFVETHPWSIGQYLTEHDRHIPNDTNIIKGAYYPVSYTYFEEFREHVTRVYTFKRHLVKHADGVLSDVRKRFPKTSVFIGVHVRRGDYLQTSGGVGWLKNFEAREVDLEYFQKAVDHYKSKFVNPTFVVVSDDRRWCRKNLVKLGMVVTPESPSPGHDMALLTRCNHTLMTYGTFGFWGAYLAGGQTVYFSNFVPPQSDFAKSSYQEDKLYLRDWVGISTTPEDYWNRSTPSTVIPGYQ